MSVDESVVYLLPSLLEFAIFCASLAVISGVYQHVSINVFGSKPQMGRRNPPGLIPWPVVGNSPFLGDQAHKTLHQWAQKYGPVFSVKLGGVNAIVLSSMETARSTLIAQKHKFVGRPTFASYKYVSRGQSVVTNDVQTQGDQWQKNKSAVIRHLHKLSTSVSSLDRMNDVITKETIRMIKHLQSLSTTNPVCPEDTIRMSVANTLCVVCYGKTFQYDNEEFRRLLSMNSEFGRIITAIVIVDSMPWLVNFPKFKKLVDEFIVVNKMLDEWSWKRTQECLAEYHPGSESNLVESMTSEYLEKDECNLDQLEEEKVVTLSALVEDVFAAGQHTSSATFFWVITYLLKYPDVLKMMQEELEEVVGERLPQYSDKNNLPYVEAFFHEVFRHSSLLSATIPHQTLDDSEVAGYQIAKGTMVIVNQYSINHDTRVWKNPEKFDPTRFLTKVTNGEWKLNEDVVKMYSIFSMGSRKCPGDRTGLRWLFFATTILAHTCELIPDADLPPTTDSAYNLVLMPRHVSLKLRVIHDRGVDDLA